MNIQNSTHKKIIRTVSILVNKKYIFIQSTVLQGLSLVDFEDGTEIILDVNSSDLELGNSVKTCLKCCKISTGDGPNFDWQRQALMYEEFQKNTATRLGYTGLEDMMEDMHSVSGKETKSDIIFSPSKREGPGWSGFPIGHPKRSKKYSVPRDSSEAMIGKAARQAISACE